MSYAIGVIAFVIALLLSVMLHEAGHFATAKAFGMKASRFFVGFGPTLWSFRRGETEYGIKAIPAGGFVKIEGMTALEEVQPGDSDRAFYRQPARQRFVVLVAGSMVHFVIAILVVFGILAVTHHDLLSTSGFEVEQVAPCLQNLTGAACTAGSDTPSPATGKLQAGDELLRIDGTTISQETTLSQVVQAHAGSDVTLLVRRAGHDVSVTLRPVAVAVGGQRLARIGVSIGASPAHVGVASAVPRTFVTLGSYLKSTGTAIGGLPHELAGIVQNKPRNDNGAASVVDVARVSGQIAASGISVSEVIESLLLIVAELNLFVGVFNLLPLLPLDGGHVGILLFEEARDRLYRLFGRRGPGRVDITKVLPLTYAVVAVFVGLSLVLLYGGITNPIRLQ